MLLWQRNEIAKHCFGYNVTVRMVAMGVSVEFENIANVSYSEYVLTGFYLLQQKKEITDFKVSYKPWAHPGKLARIMRRGKRLLSHTSAAPQDAEQGHYVGVVRYGARSVKFAINFIDTPWDFGDPSVLQEADVYFKCQYPSEFKQGYHRLSRRTTVPLSDEVKAHKDKVRPLMIGRPLSRRHDFKMNKRILDRYDKIRKSFPRKQRILAFLGMAHDLFDIANSHHPHLKRAEVVTWLSRNAPDEKIIWSISKQDKFFSKISDEAKKLATTKQVSDREYFDLIANSLSTLNITGLRGSVPFRFIDAFLSGMVVISDTIFIDWYEPLVAGKDFLCIGDLGYDLLEHINLDDSLKKLKGYIDHIEDFFQETASEREAKYKRYYCPEAVARHILSVTLKT